jgi:hypothetical protein
MLLSLCLFLSKQYRTEKTKYVARKFVIIISIDFEDFGNKFHQNVFKTRALKTIRKF